MPSCLEPPGAVRGPARLDPSRRSLPAGLMSPGKGDPHISVIFEGGRRCRGERRPGPNKVMIAKDLPGHNPPSRPGENPCITPSRRPACAAAPGAGPDARRMGSSTGTAPPASARQVVDRFSPAGRGSIRGRPRPLDAAGGGARLDGNLRMTAGLTPGSRRRDRPHPENPRPRWAASLDILPGRRRAPRPLGIAAEAAPSPRCSAGDLPRRGDPARGMDAAKSRRPRRIVAQSNARKADDVN